MGFVKKIGEAVRTGAQVPHLAFGEETAEVRARIAQFDGMRTQAETELGIVRANIEKHRDEAITTALNEKDRLIAEMERQTVGRAQAEVQQLRNQIENQAITLQHQAVSYAAAQADRVIGDLQRQAVDVASIAAASMMRDSPEFLVKLKKDIVAKFNAGGSLKDLKSIYTSLDKYIGEFTQVLPYLGAMIAAAQFLTGLFRKKEPPPVPNWVGNNWAFQHTRWTELMAACGNGLRLPFYDRFFRFRLVHDNGALDLKPGELSLVPFLHLSAIVNEPAKLMGLMAPHQQELARRVFRRLGWTLPELSRREQLLYKSLIKRLDEWRYGQFNAALRVTNKIPETEWQDARGWMKINAFLRPRPAPTNTPSQDSWPEIPGSWVQLIPELYLLCWLAPPRHDFERMLPVFETERWAMRSNFATPTWVPPAPGSSGFLISPDAWGKLASLDATVLFQYPEWVQKSLMAVEVYVQPGTVQELARVTNAAAPLSGESWQTISESIDVSRSGANIREQRDVDLRRPLVREAIALARAIRAGSGQATSVASELNQKVVNGIATLEDKTRLGLLTTALFGASGPAG